MYQYGMTQWVAGNEDIERSFERLAQLRYDSIEYAADPDSMDRDRCHALMERYGIQCMSLCGLYDEHRDLTQSPAQAEDALAYVRDSVKLAVDMGAKTLIVVPSPVGRTLMPSGMEYARAWDNAVKNLRAAAGFASDHGVTLVIEAINRYETYLVNTLQQATRMADEVDSSAVAVMADAFHMSIEEADITGALYKAGSKVRHVHIADSNRGPAGMGHTDFSAFLGALNHIGYAGTLTMEFMCRTADPYAARNMGVLSDMMDEYARVSIGYMRALEQSLEVRRISQ